MQDGCTPIIKAADYDREDVVRLMIEHKANVNAASKVLQQSSHKVTHPVTFILRDVLDCISHFAARYKSLSSY
jgi:ankyrin repeat protein